MTEEHWKPNLLLALLPFLFLSGTLLKECDGQAGSNFFYYYSPTQRTMVNHGLAGGAGQIFSSPYFTQHNPQQTQQQSDQPDASQQQQQHTQQNAPFPTVPPSFQQSTLLGFNHPQFHRQQQQTTFASVFPSPPPAQLQYPLVPPTPAQPEYSQQQQFVPQQTPPSFNTFTRFSNNAQLLGQFSQPSQPSFLSTQSPLGTVAPGAFNFFQSPFQFIQQRFMQDADPAQPTTSPDVQNLPTPSTTMSPPPPPPSPTPTSSGMMNLPPVEQIVERRPKFSSRFRYVQQPPQPQIRQYNPYSQFGTTYTSDLPFQEQRFYSSPTTPTGYAFSLGGENGNGATSTVHFSMGPQSNIKQYLTEISGTRRLLQSQRAEQSTSVVPDATAPMTPTEMMMTHDAPEPSMSSTVEPSMGPASAQPSSEPVPTMEVPASTVTAAESTNSTLEPLLNEPSFQTETIAAPATPVVASDVSQKISQTNIPKRLVIRKKVARKRLRLDGSGEVVEEGIPAMPVGVMIRRRIPSSNRLPVEQPKRSEEETPKGPVANPIPEVPSVTPVTTTTTTELPAQEQMVEMQPENDKQLSQEQPVEPSQPNDVSVVVDESPMTMNAKTESQNENASGNLMQDQPLSSMSSTVKPEDSSAMMDKDNTDAQQPFTQPSSTTPAPIQSPPVEAMMPENETPSLPSSYQSEQPKKHEDGEEYYEYYEDEGPPQTHSMVLPKSRTMTAVMANPPESADELPVLNGVQKEDFPGVFHPNSSPFDNSVETDQGEVITRITSSHPSVEHQSEEIMEEPAVSSPASVSTSTTTTTEETSSDFMREDPVEEHPPMESEEPAPPAIQPITTTEAAPMITTTASPTMSSSTAPDDSAEISSGERESAEVQDEDVDTRPVAMSPQETPVEVSSTESALSSTEAPEDHMAPVDDTVVSSTTESVQDQPSSKNEEVDDMTNDQSVSSTTEAVFSSSTTEDSPVVMEIEPSQLSSTESAQSDDETNETSTTTTAPPSATPESEQPKDIDDLFSNSQEIPESVKHQPESQEIPSDSEEIGKAQRLALEETLRRLRERQQSSSTSDPQEQDDGSPENEVQQGRRVFMRRPLQVDKHPLPTSRPQPKINAVLDDEEGVDRSQVIQKIQRFRARTTTTKRPRRVTRPSAPETERPLAVVVPVEDEGQEQVDSFSDSSSTSGTTVEPATTTSPYIRRRTTPSTPSTTTTELPEESSTTLPTMTMEEEMNYPIYTTTSTETYTTTPLPPMLTRFTDESASTTESMFDEVSSTTETDLEIVTTRMEPELRATTSSTTTTTTTAAAASTEETMTITTTPAPFMARTTTPSTTTYSPTMTDSFSDEQDDMPKNDYDVFYEENANSASDMQISSSTETSTEVDMDATPSSTTTTTTPPSSTDPVYAYVTTVEPNAGLTTTATNLSLTTDTPDFSTQTMTTTPVGQLIIHEILPTMPPLKEVSYVVGESVEDDQSSDFDTSSANESDELLAADKAVVRVEAQVRISTNSTDTGGESGEKPQELTRPLGNISGESGEGGRRRVRVVIKKQRRLRRPEGESTDGEGRRRRRKVFHRRPQ